MELDNPAVRKAGAQPKPLAADSVSAVSDAELPAQLAAEPETARPQTAELPAKPATAEANRATREIEPTLRANLAEAGARLANRRAEAAEAELSAAMAQSKSANLRVAELEASTAESNRDVQAELASLRDQSALLAQSLAEAVRSRRAVDHMSIGELLWAVVKRLKP